MMGEFWGEIVCLLFVVGEFLVGVVVGGGWCCFGVCVFGE